MKNKRFKSLLISLTISVILIGVLVISSNPPVINSDPPGIGKTISFGSVINYV